MHILFKPIALLALLILTALALPALAEEASDAAPADWTVLIYMCGSDMETNSGMATYNLREIMGSVLPEYDTRIDVASGKLDRGVLKPRINVAVETGGALEWQNRLDGDDQWGLQVANDRLQRYLLSQEYDYASHNTLELAEELPMASMADPETLADFIRWGVERCPAQKYMLVLWGHGNGASTGMIIDEIYDDDILYLYEMDEALARADVKFELVLLDACMMCNMETACVLAKYADWMVASEELAPGYGTAFKNWLRELYLNPGCDGGQLGCTICDVTHAKYSAMEDGSNLAITWAVVELPLIGKVTEAFNNLYEFVDFIYEHDSDNLQGCLAMLFSGNALGTGSECMYDMGDPLNSDALDWYIDLDIRNALVDALYDALLYSVNGVDRAGNYGLSYCYPITMSPEKLDIYARNFKEAPAYLAFLDAAVPNWEAPEWVYEQTERLTPSEEIKKFSSLPEIVVEDGLPVGYCRWTDTFVWQAFYELYREDEDTGELRRIGAEAAHGENMDESVVGFKFSMNDPKTWPAIDGVLCSIEYKNVVAQSDYFLNGSYITFYNVPIQVGSDQMNLSVGRWTKLDPQTGETLSGYKIYGTTQGFDEERGAPNRSAKPLSRLQGQEFELLYQVETADDARTCYGFSEPLTMFRGLEVEEIPLPPGTYYCRYIVENCLMQRFRSEMVKLYWDGSAFSVMAE